MDLPRYVSSAWKVPCEKIPAHAGDEAFESRDDAVDKKNGGACMNCGLSIMNIEG